MPALPGRRTRLFLALVVLGFAATAAVLMVGRPSRGTAGAEVVFLRVQEGILAGDPDALWRAMDPDAAARFERFLAEHIREKPDSPTARKYREVIGISLAESLGLTPREIMARECGTAAESHFRGARVVKVVPAGADEAVLHIGMREGLQRQWHVVRRSGEWRIHDLAPVVSADGDLLDGRTRGASPASPSGGPPAGGR